MIADGAGGRAGTPGAGDDVRRRDEGSSRLSATSPRAAPGRPRRAAVLREERKNVLQKYSKNTQPSCLLTKHDLIRPRNQFGLHQEVPDEDDEHHESTKQNVMESIEYMKRLWGWDEAGEWHGPTKENNRINYKCRNMDESCSAWAAEGECDDDEHADYMRSNCAPACRTCHTLDARLRCPIEPGSGPILPPGGLNALFERLVDDADGSGRYLQYGPRALSRPRRNTDGTPAPGVGANGPWVVVLDDFVSAAEAQALIDWGARLGYERSSDVGVENPDGSHEEDVSDGRTSHNAWCDDECEEDPVVRPVLERIAAMTGTTRGNSEQLQLLKYEPGQFYRQHHDYIEYQQDLPCGVRMLTALLYLNDVQADAGGGTRFPLLNITVQPRRGRALLWPSVLDADPEGKDFRTDHEALPVTRGVKYAANAWIHTRNYREAEENDCT